ncbi:MAG: hypothetical protein SangKO_017490 [Sandaracinaceae bacterium]|nr:hypothetical protein [Myxococcales bacterium]
MPLEVTAGHWLSDMKTSLLILALVAAALPHAAHAQDASLMVRDRDDESRIRAWMAVRASRAGDQGLVAGLAISAGVVGLGGGATIAILQDESFGFSGLTLNAVALFVVGAYALGIGVFAAVSSNLLLDDFARMGSDPLTEREIGAFEEILRQDAQRANQMRLLSGFAGGGLVLGGLAAMPVLAAFPPLDTFDQTVGWTIAGACVGLGILSMIMAAFETPAEADWREYREGLRPRDVPTISISVSPAGITGSF